MQPANQHYSPDRPASNQDIPALYPPMKIPIPAIGGSRPDYPWTPLPILQFKELEPDHARYDAWKAAVHKEAKPSQAANPIQRR